ncbi:ROK family protein [Corynebacterium sp. sy017]|uniref:polyphosphate--glucose phosphotransferase n=1 Tax=unclassified Corynebacterium TaxID=2624378 RepID=UPI001184F262|nr:MULTISPECIES: ROK family protein [unclassified Corynebacterium]MBP3087754.1 ROK family protein [Corynebacterium sp. sy017]QDZ42729.1 ROK family protein [Corynebacterium sp. sy039]TSD92304.1 ROK family protein [Corynebacterium sp. SY003]
MTRVGFGIDVGGSGIKGAKVDLDTGQFIGERIKITTPQPASPAAIAQTVARIVDQAQWDGDLGITLPAVIKEQTALTAANIDSSWVGVDVQKLFTDHLGKRTISVLNDADAAGLAEVAYGDAQARQGLSILLTFGTGIGSAILVNGTLVPNTELGHLLIGEIEAEKLASSAVKEREDLSYTKWAKRVSKVLKEYERLFFPSVFIVGGGISRKSEKWVPKLTNSTPVIPAQLRNTAGIVGAALAVEKALKP